MPSVAAEFTTDAVNVKKLAFDMRILYIGKEKLNRSFT